MNIITASTALMESVLDVKNGFTVGDYIANGTFWILSGQMPTQAELDDISQSPTDLWGLNKLVSVSVGDVSANGNVLVITGSNNYTIHATGTATWFLLYKLDVANPADISDSYRLAGTIGTVGSGADMELTNINIDINAGSRFSIPVVNISVPQQYTY